MFSVCVQLSFLISLLPLWSLLPLHDNDTNFEPMSALACAEKSVGDNFELAKGQSLITLSTLLTLVFYIMQTRGSNELVRPSRLPLYISSYFFRACNSGIRFLAAST